MHYVNDWKKLFQAYFGFILELRIDNKICAAALDKLVKHCFAVQRRKLSRIIFATVNVNTSFLRYPQQ